MKKTYLGQHVQDLQRLFFIIALGIMFLLGGCAGVNRVVSPERQVPLITGERQQGSFSQGVYSLSYEYLVDIDTITLEGRVFSGRSVSSIKVRLLFLDQQGAILAGDYIYHSPYRSYNKWRRTSFQDSVAIPDGTESVSFDFHVEERIRR